MSEKVLNSFDARMALVGQSGVFYFSLPTLGARISVAMEKLPYSIRVLLEDLVRMEDGLVERVERVVRPSGDGDSPERLMT